MKYILTTGWDDGVADLTERLIRELANGQRVLWLVSGGSNITAAVQVMDNIPPKLSRNLTILLADERYGKPGHADSNWAQLERAGLKSDHATLLPILQAGLSFEQTTNRYNRLVAQAFENNDVIIAQLGIGADGHIAGIMLDSPAAAETEALVTGFTSREKPPFKRMTLTFAGLRRVHAAYVFAFGNTKQQTLQTLREKAIEPNRQPAQILKRLPEAHIYNDLIGDDV